MMLHVFAMVQQWFIDQLREKVLRGMSDGFAEVRTLASSPWL